MDGVMDTSLKPAISLKQRLFFRFAHPLGPTCLFGPLTLLLVGLSIGFHPRSLGNVSLSLLVGIFYWTLIEYVLHRFIFHLVKVKEPWRNMASGLHMAHHRDMGEKELIIAPPMVSLFFTPMIFIPVWAITRDWSLATMVLAGVFLGYILYEWAHYGAHQYQPKNAFFRYLKRYHLLHHYKDPHGTFGVTSPIWDYVFGSTYRGK